MYPNAAPGWYHDGFAMRWWDGYQWGPYGQPAGANNDQMVATIAHLGFLVGGFVLPLVLYLIQQDKKSFVAHHAREALNFQLTFTAAWFGGFVLMFGGSLALSATNQPAALFFLIFPLMFVAMIANYVFGILGMVRAGQQVWWRYPVTFRFVRN